MPRTIQNGIMLESVLKKDSLSAKFDYGTACTPAMSMLRNAVLW